MFPSNLNSRLSLLYIHLVFFLSISLLSFSITLFFKSFIYLFSCQDFLALSCLWFNSTSTSNFNCSNCFTEKSIISFLFHFIRRSKNCISFLLSLPSKKFRFHIL